MKRTRIALASLMIAIAGAGYAQSPKPEPPTSEAPKPAERPTEDAPKTAIDVREELYRRLAASADSDETEGLVGLILASYAHSGSATGDLLLDRAHKAMAARDFPSAASILDAAIAFMPDRPEGWNARATLRYLDDDADGSMADIAETLKREPRHLGALMGMASILESRGKKEQALAVTERALAIAPHWKTAEERADRLKAEIAGQEL